MKSTKLFLLWLAMGTSPVWAQTEASLSGAMTDQTGAALPDVPVTTRNVDTGATKTDGMYKFSMPVPGDYPAMFTATLSKPADNEWGTLNFTKTAGLNQAQASETPVAAPPASDTLTWHGITLYGAYDIGVGWVSHGLPENGYNYEGESLVNRNGRSEEHTSELQSPA